MVVSAERQADLLFAALSDPTRRDILRRSVAGNLSVSALARRYPISVTAVQKHVAVLERAGLVDKTRRGREQLVQSNADSLAVARRLLDDLEQVWLHRIDRIDAIVADPDKGSDDQ